MKGIILGLGLSIVGLEIFFRFSTIASLKAAAMGLVGLAILSIGFVRPSRINIAFVFAVLSVYFVTACLRFPGLYKDSWDWSLGAFLFVAKLSGFFILSWFLAFAAQRFLGIRFAKKLKPQTET